MCALSAVSSRLCIILAGSLLGYAQPGSMREPLLNKKGRTECRRTPASCTVAHGVGLFLISSVNFILLSLKEVYFCQSLDPVTHKLFSRALASQKKLLKERRILMQTLWLFQSLLLFPRARENFLCLKTQRL